MLSLNSGYRRTQKYPSWVPDFKRETQSFHIRPIDTDHPIPVKVLEGGQVLEVDALEISHVCHVGKRCEILSQCKGGGVEDLWEAYKQYITDLEVCIAGHEVRSGRAGNRGERNARISIKLRNYLGRSHESKINGASWFPIPMAAYNMPVRADYKNGTCDHWYDLSVAKDAGMGSSGSKVTFKVNGIKTDMSWGHSYADQIANEFDGLTPFMNLDGELEFCSNKWHAPRRGDAICLLRGSSKQYILRRARAPSLEKHADAWIMVGTTYNDADFSRSLKERLSRYANIIPSDEEDDDDDSEDENEDDSEDDSEDGSEGKYNSWEFFIKEHDRMREDYKTFWTQNEDKVFKILIR